MHATPPTPAAVAPTAVPVATVSTGRWLLMLGADAVLLALLWREHLQPAAVPFALGQLLAVFVTVNAWVQIGRRLWLEHQVRKVFGASIDHLSIPVRPLGYRLLSALGDVLITATLACTGHTVLALAYGGAAVLAQAQRHRHLLFPRR